MRTGRLLPVTLALAGLVAIVVGVHQGLVHVAPGYEGTIRTGWGGDLNHSERLLVGLAALGVAGAVGARRWRGLAAVPASVGGIVLFYALRATVGSLGRPGLYTEVEMATGESVRFVLGAEPFLLVAGGVLLVAAGVRAWRRATPDPEGDPSPRSSAT